MDKKELTLEEAENIVDNMYQKRWEECGVEDGNTIHLGNLDKLHYSELEKASILLLRTEIRLKRENQKQKEIINVLDFIKARAQQGATQEIINKLAINFVNKYIKEVE